MPSNDETRPPYSVALLAVPYAVPFTVGFVFLLWGGLEFDRLITTYYGDTVNLFETFVVTTVGSILLFYASAGAFAAVVRASRAE
ncbi:hypothetical protein BRD00_03595 [Halobacteriales archaeon QS_8_69_26]|nr:MAG: hypothetical protein BRD00_03595 [Halobacteriales archaeon QS_8_69_26]